MRGPPASSTSIGSKGPGLPRVERISTESSSGCWSEATADRVAVAGSPRPTTAPSRSYVIAFRLASAPTTRMRGVPSGSRHHVASMNTPASRTTRSSVPETFITSTSEAPLPPSRWRVTSSIVPSGDQYTATGPIEKSDAIGVGGVRSRKRSISDRMLLASLASTTTTLLRLTMYASCWPSGENSGAE